MPFSYKIYIPTYCLLSTCANHIPNLIKYYSNYCCDNNSVDYSNAISVIQDENKVWNYNLLS
jgi:hypothetical protein